MSPETSEFLILRISHGLESTYGKKEKNERQQLKWTRGYNCWLQVQCLGFVLSRFTRISLRGTD